MIVSTARRSGNFSCMNGELLLKNDILLYSEMLLKPIFLKNNAKPPTVTRNLHDYAPYFGACLPEIWGQYRANFV